MNTKPTTDKLYGLDHLRALAIILVFFFHYPRFFEYPPGYPEFFEFGWTGVDLFFVLSGFLIASQLFAQINKSGNFSVKDFFLKRIFRIIPVYLVVVAIYFLFPYFREKEALPPLWKFLTFTVNFGAESTRQGTFSHVWSLCVEEHFYLFFPLILALFIRTGHLKKAVWMLAVLFLLGFALRYYCWHQLYVPRMNENNPRIWVDAVYYPTYNRLDGLLTGVSVAALYQFLPAFFAKIARYGNLLIAGGVLILTITYFFTSTLFAYSTSIIGFPLISVGYGLLVAGAVSPSCFLYKWDSKITTLIATLSYAIYLSHKGVAHITQDIFGRLGIEKNSILMLALCTLFCFAAAWLLNITIEKPFMKMRKKFINH